MPRTDDPNHRALQSDVTRFLSDFNYLVGEVTYHNAMPPELVKRLQNINTPTAWYVRTRSDCCAIHKYADLCFQLELKTGKSPGRARIEALPLAHHIRAGVGCLYVYRDVSDLFEAGFFVTSMPPIAEIVIPKRWDAIQNQYFEMLFRKCWPQINPVYVKYNPRTMSGDPFAVIRYTELEDDRYNWKTIVGDLTAKALGKCHAIAG